MDLAGADVVGDHAGVFADDERVATHLFTCLDRAYPGWRWAVTVSRASRAKTVTVSETGLQPGPESLLAPPWVPWSERVRPGDLGVGDLMPASEHDERLVPAALLDGDEGLLDWDESAEMSLADGGSSAVAEADAAVSAHVREAVPLGRSRVLSAIGRDMTAARWYNSEHGPGTPLARAAPGPCLTCGFLTPLAGSLGQLFGVCANEFAPGPGRRETASECAPQPWSSDTTRPSSGANSLAQTPNS